MTDLLTSPFVEQLRSERQACERADTPSLSPADSSMRELTYHEAVLATLLHASTLTLEPIDSQPNYRIPEMRLDVYTPMLEREARKGVTL